MQGVNIYRENNIQFLRINLNNYDEVLTDYIEDILDLLTINERKNDESIPWEEAKKEIFEQNLLLHNV